MAFNEKHCSYVYTVVFRVVINISEEYTGSIFRVLHEGGSSRFPTRLYGVITQKLPLSQKLQISRKTHVASSVNTGTSLEQLLHHMIMSHLCCDPQRSGSICTPGVRNGSLCQQEHKYLEMAILSCDE
jgi:hypothetical protein